MLVVGGGQYQWLLEEIDSGFVLRVGPLRFSDGQCMGMKKEVKITQALAPNSYEDEVPKM